MRATKIMVGVFALILLAPAFAQAHRIGPATDLFKGLPKNYCENEIQTNSAGDSYAVSSAPNAAEKTNPTRDWHDALETGTHDYGPLAAGFLIFSGPFADGNLVGNDPYNDCDVVKDNIPADFDRHTEFAHGGAFLYARSDPLTLTNPNTLGTYTGSGTVICSGSDPDNGVPDGVWADHEEANEALETTINVYVNDLVWGAAIGFTVSSDWAREGVTDQPCGDGLVEPCDPADPWNDPDAGILCNPRDRSLTRDPDFSATSQENFDTIDFYAGADGIYGVFVGSIDLPGTIGHVGTQSDEGKKKPNLPGGILLPNVLVAAFIQDRDQNLTRIVSAGVHCISGRDSPFPDVNNEVGTGPHNTAFVECGWDFKTSCSGTVFAANVVGPGNVQGTLSCKATGGIVAQATATPTNVDLRSGVALSDVDKTWRCDATFDVVPVGTASVATRGVVLCLAPIRTPQAVNDVVNGL